MSRTREALAAAGAGIVAMIVVAALGLWAAGAADLPGGAFPRVVAAVVVIAAGGSVELSGNTGDLAQADAAIDVTPLSVTLTGALVMAAVFLLPLRRRAVATPGELLDRVARTAGCWLVLLLVLALVARQDFRIPAGDGIAEDIGGGLGDGPTVGFRADVPATLGVGLVWVLAVLALAFIVSRKAPLPSRLLPFQRSVRPPAFAMLLVLLAYVAIGLAVGVIVLLTRGHPAETLAVLLLGLPNLVWMALGTGTGGAWEGHVDRPIGLPMPGVLDEVLRTREGRRTLDLHTMAEYDGRAWLLVAVAAVVLLAAAFTAAVRSPARLPAWRHALELAVALALTLLVVGLLTGISARFGLSMMGIGDLGGGLGGEVSLTADLLRLVLAGAVWGLATGFLASLLARRFRHPGDVRDARTGEGKGPGPGPEPGSRRR
ncbi:streptophobe family protein [Streptomyces luteolus]|uniref:Streptophobe family protein n=1 Tax=Streptomyces luteolus TaxID=3043615 RepID=A0ABT6SQB2_9ACTN|nr:streptophobe family protein [Streptomyces sp. B-S-A12]MDI3417799.1 streptophobe family protein [Streptomyces sp. B-S-A12]